MNFFILILLCLVSLISIIIEKRLRLANFILLMWVFLITVALLFFENEQLPTRGIAYIATILVLVLLTSAFSERVQILETSSICKPKQRIICNNRLLGILAILGFIIGLVQSYYQGYMVAGANLLGSTYHAEVSKSIIYKIIDAYCFSYVALDGYVFAMCVSERNRNKEKRPRATTLIIPILVIELATAAVSSQKSPIIWCAIFWIAGLLTGFEVFCTREEQRNKILSFVKDKSKLLFAMVLVFVVSLLLLFLVRHGESLSQTIDRFIWYGFGEVPVFSIWFDNCDSVALQHSMGGQTIYGAMKLMGFDAGLSANWPIFPQAAALGADTNIFTVFRGVIEDFGILGSFIFWTVFGFIVGRAERDTRRNEVKATLLLACYVFVLFSFLISSWHYATVIIACVLFFVDLVILERLDRD